LFEAVEDFEMAWGGGRGPIRWFGAVELTDLLRERDEWRWREVGEAF
jgi:hypothetical protein